MSNPFLECLIVKWPCEYTRRHWELDQPGLPTGSMVESRRRPEFITPIPKPEKRCASATKQEPILYEGRHPGLVRLIRTASPL
jgi:type III restriction enzyme